MNKIIYLDNASTTIPYEEAVNIYSSSIKENFANPSSIHSLGSKANRQLEKNRESILNLFKLNQTHEVLFTSGATESNNLALKGIALNYKNRGKHLITSSYEHASVLEVFKQLEKNFGFEVTYINPNEQGIITPEMVEKEIKDDTILVSIMEVNNEIGAINDIAEIAKILKKYPKIFFHSDCAQSIGKLPRLTNYKDVDLITISSHKIHGLKGQGLLLMRKTISPLPILSGGGQEYGFRSGTNDLAASSSTLFTVEKAIKDAAINYEKVKKISDSLYVYLKNHGDLFELNSLENSCPYIINFSTKTKKSSVVVEALSNAGIMVSSISACHSKKEKGSHVVKSLGKSDAISNNTIRVSFSFENNGEDVALFIENLERIIGEIK